MYDFTYQNPDSIDGAIAAHGDAEDAVYLAGGQTLVAVLKQRLAMPTDVIDLARVPGLKDIAVSGGLLMIGAMTPHAAVAASDKVRKAAPALAALAGNIGDPHVRNRGTLGGSIANNDPAADYPAALVALNATIQTAERPIPVDEFFTAMFETALEERELITRVDFPATEVAAYAKFPHPVSGFALAGVFVAKGEGGVRVAVTGAGACVFRLPEMERALTDNFSVSALEGISISQDGLNSDIHASPEYRAHLIGVLAGRAVEACRKSGEQP